MPEFLPYIISRKNQLTPTVIGFTLTPKSGTVFDYQPGQFLMLGLYDAQGNVIEKKAYSICCDPAEKDHVAVAFKVQGAFTNKLAALNEHDTVGVSGPFGVFTLPDQPAKSIVLLAGGIGITPLSMLKAAIRKHLSQPILLLYAVRDPKELAFREEIEQIIAGAPNVKEIFFSEADEPGWTGEVGRITPEMMAKYLAPFTDKQYFLCGPPIFIDVMTKQLTDSGVPTGDIKHERF